MMERERERYWKEEEDQGGCTASCNDTAERADRAT